METTDNKFKLKLGVFVAIGIAIAFTVIFYIGKQKNLFNSTFSMNAVYKNISGLQVGNHVRFSGINVGVIDDITILSDTSIRVKMILDSKVKKFIKKDATSSIGSEGLMGDKVININQGTFNSPSVPDNHRIKSIEPVEMDAMISSLQVTSQNAEVITNELAEILFKVNNGDGTLARLIRDTVIAENLSQTIVNLKEGSSNMNENMEAAKKSILLRGYFKKKDKEKERKAEEQQQQKLDKKDEEKK